MNLRTFLGTVLLAGAVGVAGAGCASSAQVRTSMAPVSAFAQAHTFALAGREQIPEDFVRTPLTNEVEREVAAALVQELEARGYRRVDVGASPDMLITGATGRRLRIERMGGGGPRIQSGLANYEVEITEGTLVLDAFDGARSQHLWHGQITGTVERGVVNREAIQRAVRRLLVDFPRAGA